jgi:hypothetical protein
MPLTKKGHKILSQMRRQYGYEEGNRVFNAAKNAGKIAGVDGTKSDDDPKWNVHLDTHPNKDWKRLDDNQHMGFSSGQATKIEELVADCDALIARLDAFENWNHQKQPEKVKPRTKDYMQPSNPHPKEVKE